MIKLTKLTNTSDKEGIDLLTKKYLSETAKPEPAKLVEGEFETVKIADLYDLKKVIESLTPKECLSYTTCLDYEKGHINTKKFVESQKDDEGLLHADTGLPIISRSGDYFTYHSGPGIFYIDIDEDIEEQEAINRLTELYTPFGGCSYLYATSCSHGINGKKGYHLYFIVDELSFLKDATSNLFKRAFKRGYGVCKLSKNGSILERTFFDEAVYGNAWLDFIAGPVCCGFDAPPRDIRVVEKENSVLKIDVLLGAVDASKEIQAERKKVKPEQKKIIKTVAKERGLSVEEYAATLQGELRESYILPSGKKLSEYIEEEIDCEIEHPVEGGNEHRCKFFFNNGCTPFINSFAHGGQKWKIITGREPILIQEPFEMLPEIDEVYSMMLETFKEWGSDRILEEQWKHQINLYLHKLLKGTKGSFSIELKPGSGKTTVMQHVVLWMYKKGIWKTVAITFQKIDDIKKAYDFLMPRLEKIWSEKTPIEKAKCPFEPKDYLKKIHSGKGSDKIGDLGSAPVIFHTHYRMRDNNFNRKFFQFRGHERNLLIFDEAYFTGQILTANTKDIIGQLAKIISLGEIGEPTGLPLKWMKELEKKLQLAKRKIEMPLNKKITFNMSKLSERFVVRAYYLEDEELMSLLHSILNIGASESRRYTVSKEKGSTSALFMMKENDSLHLDNIITTDGTRSERRVHEFSQVKIKKYNIPEYTGDDPGRIWIMFDRKDGRDSFKDNPEPTLSITKQWLKRIKPKKSLGICSKQLDPNLIRRVPTDEVIHWGMHKQTNDYQDCDAVVILHQHRKPYFAYKFNIMGERGTRDDPTLADIEYVMIGDAIDDYCQGIARGCKRNGKAQDTLLFFNNVDHVEEIMGGIYEMYTNDEFILPGLDDHMTPDEVWLATYWWHWANNDKEYLTPIERQQKKEEAAKKSSETQRAKSIYNSPAERNAAKDFRRACHKKGIPNPEELQEYYIRDWRTHKKITPVKWLNSILKDYDIKDKPPKQIELVNFGDNLPF